MSNKIENKNRTVTQILRENIYTDDLMCGASSVDDLIKIHDVIVDNLKEFNLHKLKSNYPGVMKILKWWF